VIRYVTLAEYFWLAEQVTGIGTTTLVTAARVDLADSALQSPQASFGGEEFYPSASRREQARRLGLTRLVRRSQRWRLGSGPPIADDAEAAMLSVAAHEVDEAWLATWLRDRVRFEGPIGGSGPRKELEK
jgi:death-on-curing protein